MPEPDSADPTPTRLYLQKPVVETTGMTTVELAEHRYNADGDFTFEQSRQDGHLDVLLSLRAHAENRDLHAAHNNTEIFTNQATDVFSVEVLLTGPASH